MIRNQKTNLSSFSTINFAPEKKEAMMRQQLDLGSKLNPTKVSNFWRKYKKEREIGKGAFGTVWTCKETATGVMFAVKVVNKNECAKKNKKSIELLKTEIMTL